MLQRPAHTAFQVSTHSLEGVPGDFYLLLRYYSDEVVLATAIVTGAGNEVLFIDLFARTWYNISNY